MTMSGPTKRIAIIQGENAVVSEPGTVITTLLGSCIAVCLHDPIAHIGGMNHFLLGEPGRGQHVAAADMNRYGLHAMELLINAMMQKGASRLRLSAQVFGGGNIQAAFGPIGTRNAEFALRFLKTEGIAVGQTNVGGAQARKVEFRAWDGIATCALVAQAPPLRPVAQFRPPSASSDVELFA
ncbi:chemotaxis protein CheD [Sphingobium fluviale]|uniref:Probable chemoreceptor glutamine deamidase CheD n=1 Tax=Sphingobium fluviale TaxID=2506423 RepID=A0A4Q1KFC3_9SPHN|nr:chemotaxis protein CheD [Sphingobium fluviale]RXR28378.1 chemotaxis protein CheD [Sphingobium fluviale]